MRLRALCLVLSVFAGCFYGHPVVGLFPEEADAEAPPYYLALLGLGGLAATAAATQGVPVQVQVSGQLYRNLTLTLNGSESLILSGTGTATFTTQVPAGDAYDVAVGEMAQGHLCTLTDASGTASTSGIAVAVSCRVVFYIGGNFSTFDGTAHGRLIRLKEDLSLDSSFSIGTGFNNAVFAVAQARDGTGDVYVGGNFTQLDGTAYNRIVRLNSDGSVDGGFNIGTGFNNGVSHILPLSDGSGRLYVGGQFTTYQGTAVGRFARLNSDGSIDSSFNSGAGFDNNIHHITEVDSSGSIYVLGRFTTYAGTGANDLVRLFSDGSLDGSFSVGTGFSPGDAQQMVLAVDGSKDLYVGGHFTLFQGTGRNYAVRLNSDGTEDTAFDVTTFGGGTNNVDGLTVAIDGSGDVLLVGAFANWNGAANSNTAARLLPNGTVTTWNVGTGGNAHVDSVIPLRDGSGDFLAIGNFTTWNSTLAPHFVRLTSSGSISGSFAPGAGFNSITFIAFGP